MGEGVVSSLEILLPDLWTIFDKMTILKLLSDVFSEEMT